MDQHIKDILLMERSK